MTSLSWQWGLEHRLVRFEFNFNNLLFHFNNLLVYFFLWDYLFKFLLSSILKFTSIRRWRPSLCRQGWTRGRAFPRKGEIYFFIFFYSKGSVVLSSLVLSPVPIPVFVLTRLCSKIPCHILHTWMFHHKFHTKMCHQIKHPKELLITCYTKGQPRP